jgi:hypothetical protein
VATVCLRAFGAGLFILGSSFGAFLLVEFFSQTSVIPYFVTHTHNNIDVAHLCN